MATDENKGIADHFETDGPVAWLKSWQVLRFGADVDGEHFACKVSYTKSGTGFTWTAVVTGEQSFQGGFSLGGFAEAVDVTVAATLASDAIVERSVRTALVAAVPARRGQ